jgi:cobalt-zinc-cadmium efflux system membrane fusion protein
MNFRPLCSLFAVAATLLGLAGCERAATATKASVEGPASAAAASADPTRITATPELMERIRVGEATWAAVGASVSVAAHIEVDETRVARVGSPVMGRVNGLAVREGQDVTRGQVLATITSTGLSDAQLVLLKALSQTQVATRAVERAQVLLKADVIGSAELQRREAELTQAQAELAAARDQLRLLGMPDEAIEALESSRKMNSVSRVVATMSGTVLERHIAMGQVIQPADTVFEIADLSNVWMVADVPEPNAGTLRIGQAVEANIAALPGEVFRGKLTFVSSTVNPETRTVRVRMDVDNRNRRLKPSMLATMVVRDPLSRQRVVPNASVVRDEGLDYVFVQVAATEFQLRPVKLGMEQEGRRVLEDGVGNADKIVIDGAFHLNNERRRRALRGSDGG